MTPTLSNPFLSKIIRTLRRERPITPETFPYSIWSGSGEEHLYAAVWFRTRGCRFDHQGQCSMCDYWVSQPVTVAQMVDACRQALARLNPVPDTLVVSPSGSMLDEWEVPADARRAIFQLIKEIPARRFVFETRPELVTDEVMGELVGIVDNKKISVEIGLESADPWILRNCVNKTISLETFPETVRTTHAHGATSLINVLLGTAFLSTKEAIDDAVATVRWGLSHGVDYCIVFPVHVKPWTLLQWLWEHEMYRPVSLWSLVEVLRQLGPDLCRQVYISWYRPQYKEDHLSHGKTSSAVPTTCPRCRDNVLTLLDNYRAHEDYASIETLMGYECDCKAAWQADFDQPPTQSLPERVAQEYRTLCQQILDEGAWENYEPQIRAQLGLTGDVPLPS